MNYKNNILKILSIFLSSFGIAKSASCQGINFEHDSTLAAVKLKSKKINKPIFIDCYTSRCGPCKWMVKNVFPSDTSGTFYNEMFISAKFDMEKGDGINIANKYKIQSFPTYLFLDSSGKELHRFVGAMWSDKFIEGGKKALDDLQRFSFYKDKYDNGNRDRDFIERYIQEAGKAGISITEIIYWYFSILTDEEFATEKNLALIENMYMTPEHELFLRFYKNKDAFISISNKERVNGKLSTSYFWAFVDSYGSSQLDDGTIVTNTNEKLYTKLVTQLTENEFEGSKQLLASNKIHYLALKQNWKDYTVSVKNYLANFGMSNSDELNNFAWAFYKEIDNKKDLELALSWSLRSIELDTIYANYDTYAHLCYKLKRKKGSNGSN